ncbi:heavy-metal-associated domain-containing protein [Halobacteriaceae archaeon GCM10025711]
MSQTITVEGMSCGGCEETVEEALNGVPGVTGASADRETDSATIEGDADAGALVEAVENAGYTARAD